MRDANNNHIPDAVEEFAADTMKEIREVGRDLRKRADEAKKDAVKGLHTAAETIRKEARDKGVSGDALKDADEAAGQLEKVATYLKKHTYEDMGEDVERAVKRTVRRNPLPVLAVVLVIGVIIGLLLSRKD